MRASAVAVTGIAAAQLAICGLPAGTAEAQEAIDYRVLATSKTSTMERELNEAAEDGFRVEALMGGETAFGGQELVVVMSRRPDADDGADYHYRVLATNRTSTMRSEIQRMGRAGYAYIGQTVYRSLVGGDEVVVVMGRNRNGDSARHDYHVLATARTSTLERELQEAGADGLGLVGMTVGETAFGGWELVAILERDPESNP